jgi:hypothetical protein
MEQANCQRVARDAVISADIIWQQCPPEMASIHPQRSMKDRCAANRTGRVCGEGSSSRCALIGKLFIRTVQNSLNNSGSFWANPRPLQPDHCIHFSGCADNPALASIHVDSDDMKMPRKTATIP